MLMIIEYHPLRRPALYFLPVFHSKIWHFPFLNTSGKQKSKFIFCFALLCACFLQLPDEDQEFHLVGEHLKVQPHGAALAVLVAHRPVGVDDVL